MSWWAWFLVGLGATLLVYAGFGVWLIATDRREEARAFAALVPDCVIL
jgi:hypothetical protein